MRVHHVAITVSSLDKSLEFYTKILGFHEVKRFERLDLGGRAAFVELEGFQIELWEFNDYKKRRGQLDDIKVLGITHIAIEVAALDKILSDLKAKGHFVREAKMGASGHRYAFSKDPDGIAIEFYEK